MGQSGTRVGGSLEKIGRTIFQKVLLLFCYIIKLLSKGIPTFTLKPFWGDSISSIIANLYFKV